jgi:outer membrane biogenesis lipoprotein LolB
MRDDYNGGLLWDMVKECDINEYDEDFHKWVLDIIEKESEYKVIADKRLKELKYEANKNNDVVVYNSILAYEKHQNDPSVLVKILKQINDENKELRQKVYGY